jgi:hypothetical protein
MSKLPPIMGMDSGQTLLTLQIWRELLIRELEEVAGDISALETTTALNASEIEANSADIATNAGNLTAHVAASDPHGSYIHKTPFGALRNLIFPLDAVCVPIQVAGNVASTVNLIEAAHALTPTQIGGVKYTGELIGHGVDASNQVIQNVADPTSAQHAATKNYVDTVAGSVFAIWAEENSTLGNNTWEWAYGNGANTRAGMGIVMGLDATCFALGLSLGTSGTATVELEVNGTLTGDQIALSSAQNGLNSSISTAVSAGDVINFKTISASSTSSPCQVVAWFRA